MGGGGGGDFALGQGLLVRTPALPGLLWRKCYVRYWGGGRGTHWPLLCKGRLQIWRAVMHRGSGGQLGRPGA